MARTEPGGNYRALAVIGALFSVIVLSASLPAIVAQPALAQGGDAPVAAEPGANTPGAEAPPADQPASDAPSPGMMWPTGDDDGGMMMMHRPRPTTFGGRVIAWMGAWHPAVVHFPIALLLTVALLEMTALVRRKPVYAASNKMLLGLAAAGALVAAPLGWADAGMPGAEDGGALTVHRWIGTAIPFLMLLLWSLKQPAELATTRRGSRRFGIVLAAAVTVVLVQAYLGGEVTHGAGHMAF